MSRQVPTHSRIKSLFRDFLVVPLHPGEGLAERSSTIGLDDTAMTENDPVKIQTHQLGNRSAKGGPVLNEPPENSRATNATVDAIYLQKEFSKEVLPLSIKIEQEIRDDERPAGGVKEDKLVELWHSAYQKFRE